MSATHPPPASVGVVVIGRNEGERLKQCLASLLRAGAAADHIVYVDSGSSDGSVDHARGLGLDVIPLTPPFTAAKGRNAGFVHITNKHPALSAVQFVDGDCEYDEAWLSLAAQTLADDATIVAVNGIQKERFPERTVYNLLCDIEWASAFGDIDAFTGNVMMRATALRDCGLFNDTLIAGEDPELSIRLRKAGGRIVRLRAPMCLHDLDMHRFSQWWNRNVRAGHAFAEVNAMHGDAPLHFWHKEVRSNWLWGAALPVGAATSALPTLGGSVAGLGAAYGVLFLRVYKNARARGLDAPTARAYAAFTAIGKVPTALGQAKYWLNRARGARTTLIEYKKDSPR